MIQNEVKFYINYNEGMLFLIIKLSEQSAHMINPKLLLTIFISLKIENLN